MNLERLPVQKHGNRVWARKHRVGVHAFSIQETCTTPHPFRIPPRASSFLGVTRVKLHFEFHGMSIQLFAAPCQFPREDSCRNSVPPPVLPGMLSQKPAAIAAASSRARRASTPAGFAARASSSSSHFVWISPRKKFGLSQDAAEQTDVGANSGNGVFVQSTAQTRNGFFAAVSPGDKFAQQRIVVHRHGPALVDALVKANAGTGGALRRAIIFPGQGKKLLSGSSAYRRTSIAWPAWRDRLPCERQPVSRSDGDLQLHQIEAGDLLRHRMLHLQARVHFEEIKIEAGIHQEFHRARVDVPARARQAHRGIAHFAPQIGSHHRRRRFFDHLLVAPLHEHSRSPATPLARAHRQKSESPRGVGRSRYFSTETRASPNAFSASEAASRNAAAKLRLLATTRMPLPPPPAIAFSSTG